MSTDSKKYDWNFMKKKNCEYSHSYYTWGSTVHNLLGNNDMVQY
jgi:hypothetical protein